VKHVVLILCALVLILPLNSAPQPEPQGKDVFDQFADSYRQLIADNWQEMAEAEFDSENEQLDWINERNEAARHAAFQPVADLAANAAMQGAEFVARFADALKDRNLGRTE